MSDRTVNIEIAADNAEDVLRLVLPGMVKDGSEYIVALEFVEGGESYFGKPLVDGDYETFDFDAADDTVALYPFHKGATAADRGGAPTWVHISNISSLKVY